MKGMIFSVSYEEDLQIIYKHSSFFLIASQLYVMGTKRIASVRLFFQVPIMYILKKTKDTI